MAAAATPRKKLPPPTTRPICTPVRATSAISSDKLLTRAGSIPKALPPAKTSPLSLRTMRWYLGIYKPVGQPHLLLFRGRRLLRRLFDQRGLAHFKSNEAR